MLKINQKTHLKSSCFEIVQWLSLMNFLQGLNRLEFHDNLVLDDDVCVVFSDLCAFVFYLYWYLTLCFESCFAQLKQQSILIDFLLESCSKFTIHLKNGAVNKVRNFVSIHPILSRSDHIFWPSKSLGQNVCVGLWLISLGNIIT